MARPARVAAGLTIFCVATAAAEDLCSAVPRGGPQDVAGACSPPPAGVSLLQVQARGDRVAESAPAKLARARARAKTGASDEPRKEAASDGDEAQDAEDVEGSAGGGIPDVDELPGAHLERGPSVLIETAAKEMVAAHKPLPKGKWEDKDGKKKGPCLTTWKDPRARGWWRWSAKPDTPCCWECDPEKRTVKGHCIRDTYFGDWGWCYTKPNYEEWGSCSEDCPQYAAGESKPSCVTTMDGAASKWWDKQDKAGSACVFGTDFRDEGKACIPEFEYGSNGWCYTNPWMTQWGSCSPDCPVGDVSVLR